MANQLAAIPDLRVTGRASSFSFKGKNEDLGSIAKKLGVADLLEGSLRGDGEQAARDGATHRRQRRHASLVVASVRHEQSGILAAQDEIAQDVARALSVTLDVGALEPGAGRHAEPGSCQTVLGMARADAR